MLLDIGKKLSTKHIGYKLTIKYLSYIILFVADLAHLLLYFADNMPFALITLSESIMEETYENETQALCSGQTA